jgi:hypothetical protein
MKAAFDRKRKVPGRYNKGDVAQCAIISKKKKKKKQKQVMSQKR